MKRVANDLLKGVRGLPFKGLRFPWSGLVPATLRRPA